MDQFLVLMLDPFVDGRGAFSAGAVGGAMGFAPDQASSPDDVALAYTKVLKAPAYQIPSFEPLERLGRRLRRHQPDER